MTAADALTRAKLLPIEFRGRARVFRNEVRRIDAETERALAVVVKPLRERLAHHPALRHEQIAGALRTYALGVPPELRFGPVTVCRDRRQFSITEVRLFCTWLKEAAWAAGTDEIGIAVGEIGLQMVGRAIRLTCRPRAIIGLHALGRRIERGTDGSHQALIHDLGLLADADSDGDQVACDGGAWVGRITDMTGEGASGPCRNVRTWHLT